MAYRDFKMKDLKAKFGIQEIGTQLFDRDKIKHIEPSDKLKSDLEEADFISLSTEKAVSERIIAPIIVELVKLNKDFIQIYSGENIKTENGLSGQIDFIIDCLPITMLPRKPYFIVVQSKIGFVFKGFDKAIAQALGIHLFNKLNKKTDNQIVYAIATDGKFWNIGKLEDNNFYIDTEHFSTYELPLLLGALQEIVNFYKAPTQYKHLF
jgi:hypothetical protein